MKRSRGFTLIELVIFIVIVGAAVGGVSMAFIQATTNINQPAVRQHGMAIANGYMDEILRKKWNQNSPIDGGCVNTGSGTCPAGLAPIAIGNDGQGRAAFDDVDDYNGIAEVPTDQTGTPMPGGGGYAVTVAVVQPAAAWNGIPAADVRQITVTVTTPSGDALTVVGYRVNY